MKQNSAQKQKYVPTPREKVMLLTRVLYEKKSLKEACLELQIPYQWGKAIWSEHSSQYNKTKKLYKKSDSLRGRAPIQRTAGVRVLCQGQHIGKYIRVKVLVEGKQ